MPGGSEGVKRGCSSSCDMLGNGDGGQAKEKKCFCNLIEIEDGALKSRIREIIRDRVGGGIG